MFPIPQSVLPSTLVRPPFSPSSSTPPPTWWPSLISRSPSLCTYDTWAAVRLTGHFMMAQSRWRVEQSSGCCFRASYDGVTPLHRDDLNCALCFWKMFAQGGQMFAHKPYRTYIICNWLLAVKRTQNCCAGHMGFAVLQCCSKSYEANLTIKMTPISKPLYKNLK